MTQDNLDKLRILLPHWIEHNAEHAAEFRRWGKEVDNIGDKIELAAQKVEEANDVLAEALEELGGALEQDHGHDHDH
jgi:hypothetical protein